MRRGWGGYIWISLSLCLSVCLFVGRSVHLCTWYWKFVNFYSFAAVVLKLSVDTLIMYCCNTRHSFQLSTSYCLTFYQMTILGLPKLKAFSEDKSNVTQNIEVVFHRIDKSNVTQNIEVVFHRIENIVKKKKMLVTSIFFFSHNVFKGFFLQYVKSRYCVVMGQMPSPIVL